MKKLLLPLALVILLGSCKDNEPTVQTFFVNVYYKYSKTPSYGEKIASPTTVYIFKDNGKAIDTKASSVYFGFDGQLTYTDGTRSELYSYVSDGLTGINTFKDVPNGNYVVWVTYKSSAYTQYFSSKKITVNYDYRSKMETKVFDFDMNSGYQEW